LESTYGDRDHKDRGQSVLELAAVIDSARGGAGKVMIPAFAVGRTQDVLYHLGELSRSGRLDGTHVFVDSPMAIDATELYRRHRECFDAPAWALIDKGVAPLSFPNLDFTRTGEESKRLNAVGGGAVVIAASGMCTGGRILHHLKHGLWQEDSHVVFVGFQAQGSLGRLIVDGARSVSIMGDRIPVKAHIHTIGGFSAHAGQTGLMQWAAGVTSGARRMFLTHGEPAVRDVLKGKLVTELGRSVECPWFGDSVELAESTP
jgi:metallo-beta-lactamase family protein